VAIFIPTRIAVLFCGSLRDLVGADRSDIEIIGASYSTKALKGVLGHFFPALRDRLGSTLIGVLDRRYNLFPDELDPSSKIALIDARALAEPEELLRAAEALAICQPDAASPASVVVPPDAPIDGGELAPSVPFDAKVVFLDERGVHSVVALTTPEPAARAFGLVRTADLPSALATVLTSLITNSAPDDESAIDEQVDGLGRLAERELPEQALILTVLADRWAMANGRVAAKVVERLQALPSVLRTSVLAAPGCIAGLAKQGQAANVLQLVAAMESAQRATALAAAGAIKGLCEAGLDAQVISFIEALPLSMQTQILSMSGAVQALAENGQAARAAARVKELVKAGQVAVAIGPAPGLVELAANGQGEVVVALVAALPPDLQTRVLTNLAGRFSSRVPVSSRVDLEKALDLVERLDAEQQTCVLASLPARIGFSADQSTRAVALLDNLTNAQRARVLSAPRVLWGLAAQSRRDVAPMVATLDAGQRAGVLAAPGAIWRLSASERWAMVVNLIQRLEPGRRADLLATPNVGFELAASGLAAWTVKLIEDLDLPQRARVLAAPGVVWGLACPHAVRVVKLIESLDPERRTDILANGEVVAALGRWRQGRAVATLMEDLDAQQRIRVLTAKLVLLALAAHGEAARVIALLETLDRGSQTQILATQSSTLILVRHGQGSEVRRLLATLDGAAQMRIVVATVMTLGGADYGDRFTEVFCTRAPPNWENQLRGLQSLVRQRVEPASSLTARMFALIDALKPAQIDRILASAGISGYGATQRWGAVLHDLQEEEHRSRTRRPAPDLPPLIP
jgi:hypothetical protein